MVAPRRVYDPKRVRIQATVAGFGSARGQEHRIADAERKSSANQDRGCAGENGRAQVEFLGLDAPYGFSRGEVRIDSADTLPADDQFPFAVERTDPRKVLFVDDGRRPRAELYFRAALDASPDAAFQLESMRPEQAANVQLSNYAVVVLSDLGVAAGADSKTRSSAT